MLDAFSWSSVFDSTSGSVPTQSIHSFDCPTVWCHGLWTCLKHEIWAKNHLIFSRITGVLQNAVLPPFFLLLYDRVIRSSGSVRGECAACLRLASFHFS